MSELDFDINKLIPKAEPPKTDGEDMSIKEKAKRNFYGILESGGNYIVVGLLAVVSLLFSFVRFDNATVGLKLPHYDNFWGWAIFIIMTVVPVIIGLMIKTTLRRQGIKIAIGKPTVSSLQDEYNELLTVETVAEHKPRSLTEYMRGSLLKETAIAVIMITMTTVLMVGVALSDGGEGIVKQLINFLMWGIFGLKNMLDANDYIMNEYKQWLIIHIKELKGDTVVSDCQPKE